MLSILLLAAINLGTLQGIDCSQHFDSGPALIGLFANLSNEKVVIPAHCRMLSCQPLTINGQESWIIEGEGDRPINGGGPSITGCGTFTGPVLTINRSGFWTLKGFGIFTEDVTVSSNFTRSLDIDNSGSGGYTTTHGNIEHMAFTTNIHGGGTTANYVGINIIGRPNSEHMILRDNWINCQNSPNSYGIQVAGVNSDNDLSDGNSIGNCFQGIRQSGGNIRMVGNHLGSNGNFSVFGPGGAAIYIGYCPSGPVFIGYNEASDGGPFISGGCLRQLNIIGNYAGISDIGPDQYPVNIGYIGVPLVLIGNDFYVTAHTSKAVIGSDFPSIGYPLCTYGPQGALIDIGNFNSFPTNTNGWTGCPGGPDFVEGHYQMGTFDKSPPIGSGFTVVPGSGGYGTGLIHGVVVP